MERKFQGGMSTW